MVNITANYTSLLTGEKDQNDVLRARGFTEEQIKAAGLKSYQPKVSTMGLEYSVPLVSFKYPLLSYVLILLENYEKGSLPYPGAVSDQPSHAMEILNLVKSIKQEFQHSQQIRDQKK